MLVGEFPEDGFVVSDPLIDAAELGVLRAEADRLLEAAKEKGGARNGLLRSVLFRRLAQAPNLRELAGACLGAPCDPVKLTVFDKTPRSNWKVPWHQDFTITVRERRDVPGIGPWSVKGGLPHAQAPAEILERIVALRLHLDPTPPENAPLRVLPGTHRTGRLRADEIASLASRVDPVVCTVAAGGVMAMSPLLVHASSPAAAPVRRRVLHFAYSSADLPGGLQWA